MIIVLARIPPAQGNKRRLSTETSDRKKRIDTAPDQAAPVCRRPPRVPIRHFVEA